MNTNKPKWQLVANLGDVNPIENGGIFVYTDKTGIYSPEVLSLDYSGKNKWEVRRFILEPCFIENGILSYNSFHKNEPAWFADKIEQVASFVGQSKDEFLTALVDQSPENLANRAHAWLSIGRYFGMDNLDSYPSFYTRKDIYRYLRKECY
jgi:hypothetical protein